MLKLLADTFWSENVWLPPNVTWDDIAPGPEKAVNYSNHTHIWYPIPLALLFIVLQCAFDRKMSRPFSRLVGLREVPYYHEISYPSKWKPSMKSPNTWNRMKQVIERFYKYLSCRCRNRPSELEIFCESVWNFIFYIFIFSFGIYVLRDKGWLWDLDQCYVGYPHHGITNDVWWYYMLSSAFYWSLMYRSLMNSLIWYKHQKHFWKTLVHHAATIALLYFSWVCNLHRIGTLVLLCHNISDIFLQSFKAAAIVNYRNLGDTLLLLFMISWIGTRFGVYPYYMIWSTMYRMPELVGMFPAYYIFNTLLCLLLFLHVVRGPHNLILIVIYDNIKPLMQKKSHSNRQDRTAKRKNSTSDRGTKQDENKRDLFDLFLKIDVNKYVDMGISQLVPLMKTSGLDPLDLPDIGGSEKGNRGFMTGLANVTRSGDQYVTFLANQLSIRLQFQFRSLELVYTYMTLLSRKIEGSCEGFTVAFDLLIDFNNEKPLLLKEFSLTNISEIRVQLSDNIFNIDMMINRISSMFTKLFHKAIVDAVQCNIADNIQDVLDFANVNIKEIIQSILLYSVFQDKRISNVIIERFAEWKQNKRISESEVDVDKTNELRKQK